MKLTKQQLKRLIKEELQESDRPYDAGRGSIKDDVVYIVQDQITGKIMAVFKDSTDAQEYKEAHQAEWKNPRFVVHNFGLQ